MGLAEAFDAGETGRGEQEFGLELLRGIERDEWGGDIEPAGVGRGALRGKGLLRSGCGWNCDEGPRQTGEESTSVNHNRRIGLRPVDAPEAQVRLHCNPRRELDRPE